MKRLMMVLAVILAILAWVAVLTQSTVCTEDMKCWNCHTMGNHICGKVQVQ